MCMLRSFGEGWFSKSSEKFGQNVGEGIYKEGFEGENGMFWKDMSHARFGEVRRGVTQEVEKNR